MKIVRVPKIIIIEDQLIIAADIQLKLVELGYEVIGIHQCAKDALLTISKNQTDFILIDIGLSGSDNGIEVAQQISKNVPTPILILSHGIDRATFQIMKEINPYAFIPKPFQMTDLQRGIKTALWRLAWEKQLRFIHSTA